MATVDRKTQIIEEATRLFSQHGYDKVTIKQVGEICGISEPAVYRHFQSKEALYDAVLDALGNRLRIDDVFDELRRKDDIEDFLYGLATHVIDYFSKNDEMYRLLLFSALRGHAKARQVYDTIRGTYVRFMVEKLNELYQNGNIIEKNNEITARCFTGMVFDCALGRTLWRGLQGKAYDPADIIANNVPIYARGLRK